MAIRRYCALYFNLSAEPPEAVQQRSAKHMAFLGARESGTNVKHSKNFVLQLRASVFHWETALHA